MKPCARCHRHVRRAESACPFCGAALHDAPAPPALAAWSLGATLLFACGPAPAPEAGDSSTTSGTTSGATTTTSTADATTLSSTTSSSTGPTPTTGCGDACNASDEGAGFIYGAPDGGQGVKECDIFTQDCRPGQKCAPFAKTHATIESTHCVPVTGEQQPGEPCTVPDPPRTPPTGHDDCDLGSMCWEVDDMGHGTCIAHCTGTPDAPVCAPGSVCSISNNSALVICLPDCDPLQQDCEDDEACIPNGNNFLCVIDVSRDEGQANDPCEFANSCDPGLTCLDRLSASSACPEDKPSCCSPFCEFPNSPCPNPDQKCVQWFAPEDINPGNEDIGVCAIPM